MAGKKTIVVKIGTSSLTEKSGRLSPERLRALTAQVADLRGEGHQVVMVTSAAIAAGYTLLGYHKRPVAVAATAKASIWRTSTLTRTDLNHPSREISRPETSPAVRREISNHRTMRTERRPKSRMQRQMKKLRRQQMRPGPMRRLLRRQAKPGAVLKCRAAALAAETGQTM